MAISESLGKSIDRYEQLYARVNQSPLGAAASAGTSWPLDRERTAALLGFDGLVIDTIEGTAGMGPYRGVCFRQRDLSQRPQPAGVGDPALEHG
jgi:hypothetical protein